MEMLAVGVVTAAHGLKGEVTVRSFSGRIDHLRRLRSVLLRRGAEERRAAVQSVRPKNPHAVMKIEGVDSPEQAGLLRGFEIWVPRAEAAPLERGEFYATDLCGCGLFFGPERLGSVRAVVEAGGSQLLEVEDPRGKFFLVPFVEHFVGEVDVPGGRIELRDRGIVP
jgi:16S rRNA processing protein RimM